MSAHNLHLMSLGSAGCNAKIRAKDLVNILGQEKGYGFLSSDAGTMLEGENTFFTIDTILPITKDAIQFGKVAIYHALNDLFCKGANVMDVTISFGFTKDAIVKEIARKIIEGTNIALTVTKARLSKAHSYTCEENTITVAAVGQRLTPTRQMQEGDTYSIYLTKPLGATLGSYLGHLTENIPLLTASESLLTQSHHSLVNLIAERCFSGTTDISGFGLLGHLASLSIQECCTISIKCSNIPFIPDVKNPAYLEALTNCAAQRNEIDFQEFIEWKTPSSSLYRRLLYNAETSGPIACILNPEAEHLFGSAAQSNGFEKMIKIGEIAKNGTSKVIIT